MRVASDRDQAFLSIARELPRFRAEQRYGEAIQWLNSLIENTSDNELTMTARMGIATCLVDLKRYEEAEQIINSLLNEELTREQKFHLQQLRATLLEQTGKLEACLGLIRKLLSDTLMLQVGYEETRAELLSSAGFVQTQLGCYSDAIRSLSDSLTGTPKGERRDFILLYLAVCLRAERLPSEALAKVEEGLTAGTGLLKGDFSYQQGLALKELGFNHEAQVAFRRAYADADFGDTSREKILLEMEDASRPI